MSAQNNRRAPVEPTASGELIRPPKPTRPFEPTASGQPKRPRELARPPKPTRAEDPAGSEEQGGEGGPGLGYPWVAGREDLEELDQVDAGLAALLARSPAYDAEEPVERLVH